MSVYRKKIYMSDSDIKLLLDLIFKAMDDKNSLIEIYPNWESVEDFKEDLDRLKRLSEKIQTEADLRSLP